MTHDSRTTRRQSCRACAVLTSGDCGQHESQIDATPSRGYRMSPAGRQVTIDAGLLDDLVRVVETEGKHAEGCCLKCRVLARVKVAREMTARRRSLQLSETNTENPYGPVVAGCEVPPTKDELRARIATLESERDEAWAQLMEDRAVCLCGCVEHESYGEDGESCGHDEHECLRVAPAVLQVVTKLREELARMRAAKEGK